MDGVRVTAVGDGVEGAFPVEETLSVEGALSVEVGTGWRDWRASPLWGRGLRLILVDVLRRRPTTTVAELVAALRDQGFRVEGRASKVVSDALRWEVAAGRVERLARGVYRFVGATRSHKRRAERFASVCRHWVVAVTRGQTPTPTPRDRPGKAWICAPDAATPPWVRVGWIWGT